VDEEIWLDSKFRPDLLGDEECESQQAKSEREANNIPGQAQAEPDRNAHEKPKWPMFNDSMHSFFSFSRM
jgi:hypothetical protein